MKKIIGLLALMLGCVVVLVSCSNANGSVILDSSGNPTNVESCATGSDRPTTAESTYHRTEENKKRGSVSKYELPKDGNYYECALKDKAESLDDITHVYLEFESTKTNENFTIKDGKFYVKDTYKDIDYQIIMLNENTFISRFGNGIYTWYIYDTDYGYFLVRHNGNYKTYFKLGV